MDFLLKHFIFFCSLVKPGVLRFGPPSENIPGGQNSISGQSPLRPTPTAAMAPNAGPPSTPESAHQPAYNQPPPSQQGINYHSM